MKPGSALPLDPTEPLYIVELGAGSGKFSFYMLQALNEMQEVCDFPLSKIVYVMTDFTESNFKFWKDHPGLAPFIESGQLDIAIFDAVNDTSITLHHSRSRSRRAPSRTRCASSPTTSSTRCATTSSRSSR